MSATTASNRLAFIRAEGMYVASARLSALVPSLPAA